ncbi:MAG: ROK family protein [Candidatus Saccharicenans sp.]|nr:ROK family protein [Candidatus Saccharicenans sp.]
MKKKQIQSPVSSELLAGAIDIGGTKIASALVNRSGRMLFMDRVLVRPEGGRAVLDQVISLAYQLEAKAGKQGRKLGSLGLCVPGLVNPTTGLVWAPNIPGWKDFQLVKHLRKAISCPLVAVSDRTAYVLGEAWKGAARNKRNVIYLAVGTGIGAGIMAEGTIIHGEADLAGAVGWLALNAEFKAGYANSGCFEWEASGGALARKALDLLAANPRLGGPQADGRPDPAKAVEIICQAARQGQPEALELVREVQEYLAMGVANLVSTFNPEVVVLGGGLFQSPDLFFEPIRKQFKRWAQPLAARSVELVLSALGQEAALYGCARSAWLEIERPENLKGRVPGTGRGGKS